MCPVKVEFYFSNYSSTVDVKSAIAKVRYGGYQANLAAALSVVRNNVFVTTNGARLNDPAVSKLAVIITDNPSSNKTLTQSEAWSTRNAGIGLVTIGVGTYLDLYELSAVASFPYSSNMMTVSSVRNLTLITDNVKRIICNGETLHTYSCFQF